MNFRDIVNELGRRANPPYQYDDHPETHGHWAVLKSPEWLAIRRAFEKRS